MVILKNFEVLNFDFGQFLPQKLIKIDQSQNSEIMKVSK